MRLLEITNDFPPVIGGIENYIYSLISRWKSDEVVVLTRMVDGWEEFDRQLQFRVERVPVGTLLPTPDLFRRAMKLIDEENIEAVHFVAPFPLPLIGPRLLERTGVPYSVTIHGGEFVLASRLPGLKSLLRRTLSKASVLLCESTFVMNEARRFFSETVPTEFVPAGVDTSRFTPGLAPAFVSKDGGPVLVSVSRLIARKGPANLIRSLPRVIENYPRAHALIVGGGPDRRKLEKLAASSGVEDSVTFAGAIPWEEVPGYYASGKVFVMPTRPRFGGLETEGLPLTFLEAAACGISSVAGAAGGVSDAVVDGDTGFIVDGGNPGSISRAVLHLLDDPALAASMGKKARERVVRDFTWDRSGQRFEEAILRFCR